MSLPLRMIRGFGSQLLLLVFPLILVFLVYPLDIFNKNSSDFGDDPVVLEPFFWATAASFILCFLAAILLRRSRPKIQDAVTSVALWLGCSFIFNDLIVPVRLTASVGFDGKESILAVPLRIAVFGLVAELLAFVLICIWRRDQALKIGSYFVGIFLVITAAPAIFQFLGHTRQVRMGDPSSKWFSIPAASERQVDHPNVYHILLDGFRGAMFPNALKEAGLTNDTFDGFTYFAKNRSNFDGTQTSTPAFLTGTLFHGGSFKTWVESWTDTGIFPAMKLQLGTNIQAYSFGAYHELTRWVQGRRIVVPRSIRRTQDLVFHLSLARAAPLYRRERVFKNGFGIFSRWTLPESEGVDSRLVPLLTLISDEKDRPARGQYVFSHIYFPHAPYVIDKFGRPSWNASMLSQSACALRLVADLIAELKRTGRYDDSIIVIHSDHGWGNSVPAAPGDWVPEAVQVELWKRSAQELNYWTSALLLVKPAGKHGTPMVVSSRPTQLLDLPNTMYDLLGMKQSAPEGQSVIGADYPTDPERQIFTGFRRWSIAENRQLWFGTDIFKGDFNHFVFTEAHGFKVLPLVPVEWESSEQASAEMRIIQTPLIARRKLPTVIELSWPPSISRGQYEIQMASDDQQFATIGKGSASSGRYEVGDVSPKSSYRFRARWIVRDQTHTWSAAVVVPGLRSLPSAAGVKSDGFGTIAPQLAGVRSKPTVIELSWPKVTTRGACEIEMATGEIGQFVSIGRGSAQAGRYVVGDVASDSSYRFRSRFTDLNQKSAWSSIVKVPALAVSGGSIPMTAQPLVPGTTVTSRIQTQLFAHRTSPSVIRLSWPLGIVRDSLEIEMSSDGNPFVAIGRGSAGPGEYYVGDVSPDSEYEFRARGWSNGLSHPWSKIVEVPAEK